MRNGFHLNRPPTQSLISVFETGRSIPRIIHQTYHAPPWPAALLDNKTALEAMNPDWDYRFHDYDARRIFIGQVYGSEVLARYDSISPRYGAARADLFRYLLLYKCGGVYLDMKSSTSKPLDDVIRDDDVFLLSSWRSGSRDDFKGWGRHAEVSHLPNGEFQQWFIASAPGHPFLRAIIEAVLRNIAIYVRGIHGAGAYAVLRVTGPVAYTLAIAPLMATQPHRVVDSRDDLGLVYSIFDKGAARSHEKMFPHYSTLTEPLVRMSVGRHMLSIGFGGMKKVVKTFGRLLKKPSAVSFFRIPF